MNAPFCKKDVEKYILLVISYVQKARQRARTDMDVIFPFFDVSPTTCMDDDVRIEFEEFVHRRHELPTLCRLVCEWYVKEAANPGQPSFYEELINVLEMGGDFYEHHGSICFRDIATVPIADRAARK